MSTSPKRPTTSDPSARATSRRGRWILLWCGVIIACAGAAWTGYRRLTDPQRLRTFAENYLQGFFNGKVSVGSAEFGWLDQVTLRDVHLSAVEADLPDSGLAATSIPTPVFSCRQVELVLRARSLLRGKLEIDSLSAQAPEWTIRRDVESGLTNLHGLLRAQRLQSAAGMALLPRLELQDSILRVIRTEDGAARAVEDLRLTVRGNACKRDPRWYDVVWTRGDAHGVSGHSQIDLENMRLRNVRGGLPWLSIEAVAIAVDSHFHHAAQWSDLLGLEGAVRASDYDFDANDATGGRFAVLELQDATLAIPLPGAQGHAPVPERFLRFQHVFGHIKLTADALRADFDGRMHDSDCHAVLTMKARDEHVKSINDVDLEARLTVRSAILPRLTADAPLGERRFVEHWGDFQRFYERFDPHGAVDFELEVARKAGADAAFELRYWMIRALGGDASFVNFPYRLYGADGVVVGTPGGIWIDRLRGHRDGTEVEVNGWYADTSHCAQANIRVTGRHVPIDDVLCQALSPRFQNILGRFQPEGEIDLDIMLRRPPCAEVEPMAWDQTVTITLPGVSARYAGFPYPIEDLHGAVIVRDRGMLIPQLRGRAGDGELRVTGQSVFSPDEGSDTALTIQALDVPVDSELLSALPATVERQVSAFHPQGMVDAEVEVRQEGSAAPVELRADVHWRRGQLQHESLPIPLDYVTARLLLADETLHIQDFQGAYDGALITATGVIEDLSSGRPLVEIQAETERINVGESLYAQAPPSWLAALSGWRVYGAVAVRIGLRYATGTQTPPQWTLAAALADADLRHAPMPLPITRVRGEVLFNDQGWETPQLEGVYNDGHLKAAVQTRKDEGEDEGSISLEATDLTIDSTLYALLPAEARTFVEHLAPQGRVDVSLPVLSYARNEAGKRLWSFAGRAVLHDLRTDPAMRVEGAEGVIEAAGTLVDRSGGAAVNGTLRLDRVRLSQRELEDIDCQWSLARTADGRGRLALEKIDGRLYDGTVSGDVELYFGQGASEYRGSATMLAVDVDRLVNAGWDARLGKEPARIGGALDARLRLAGAIGDAAARSGGGRVEVAGARLQKVPLIMAILNVINLSPPDQEMFADASADLLIMGNRIDLKNIELTGTFLSLFGAGQVAWPDLALDIRLVNVHNERWSRVPGLTDFMERASRELVELHVTGSAQKPTVRTRPMPTLTDEFRELFQKRKPKRIESSPS